MSLYFWQPADDWAEDSFRKKYNEYSKDTDFPSHIRVIGGIHNDELDCHSVGQAIKRIRSENLNWALGTPTHLPYQELEGVLRDPIILDEVNRGLG